MDPSDSAIQSFVSEFQNNYAIFQARTPDQARKVLSKHRIHLVIAEYELPGMTGLEFLCSLTRFPNLIRIVIGDSRNANEIIKFLNTYHIHKFVVKPWNAVELKATLEDALDIFSKKKKNKKVLSDLRYLLDQMNLVHEVSMQISERKSLARLLTEIMESSKTVMNAEASSLLLYDPGDKALHFQVATGEKGTLVRKYSVEMGEGIAGWVAKHRKEQLIEDCYKDSRFNPSFDERTNFRTKSMICVPLVRKRKLLGVIQVINKKDGQVFTDADLTTFSTLASQCAISIENAQLIEIQIESEALERELRTARDIQNHLLPATLPVYDDLDIAAKLIPARMVGGDYYNFVKINDRQSLFFIADVSGKGIPAALIVSTIFSCLKTYLNLNPKKFDLLTLVYSMNRALIESTTLDRYATVWFGLYDHRAQTLTSINAGHNPPYIFRQNRQTPLELKKGGIILGVMEVPFENEVVEIRQGDVLAFFTDGVTEAWNKKEEDYGELRLIKVIKKAMKKSAPEILAAIKDDVDEHVSGAPQSDDFTCAVVKMLSPNGQ